MESPAKDAIPVAEAFPFGNNVGPSPTTALAPRLIMPDPSAIFTNIPADESGIGLRLAVCGQTDKRAGDLLNTELLVTYYHVSERMAADESGEVLPGPRLVLILQDGTTVASSGSAVLKGLAELIACFGCKPWIPPLRLKIQGNKSSNGFSYHSLRFMGRVANNTARRAS